MSLRCTMKQVRKRGSAGVPNAMVSSSTGSQVGDLSAMQQTSPVARIAVSRSGRSAGITKKLT
jgi:hypothetical protein